jgi:starvation-inducible DNA-binding protein
MNLIQSLREALASVFVYSFKAQSFHWNVTSMFFVPLHELFGEIYEDAYSSVDNLAEYIRIEGALAPASLVELYSNSAVTEETAVPGTPSEMLSILLDANNEVINKLNLLMEAASASKAHGIADYVSTRIDAHKKFQWKLRSHLA